MSGANKKWGVGASKLTKNVSAAIFNVYAMYMYISFFAKRGKRAQPPPPFPPFTRLLYVEFVGIDN